MDVKATSTGRRSHEISFEQANPPEGTRGFFASIWIETAGGGTTLSDLLARIEARLRQQSVSVSKLRSVVAETLGNGLPTALNTRFDVQLARSSLLLYEAAAVPAVRPTLPVGISGLRFTSDFSGCAPIDTIFLRKELPPRRGCLATFVMIVRDAAVRCSHPHRVAVLVGTNCVARSVLCLSCDQCPS